jgi:signal transduction histidine kinase
LTQPLTVIRLLIENALAKLETTSSPKAVIEKLRDSLTEVSNITSVVDRLRSLARKSSGKNFKEVDLGAIASRIVNLLNESVHLHGFSLCLEDMDELPHIYSSDRDMEQLFFSLVDNALQEGHGDRRLVIKGDVKGEFVELSFSDNCGGISPENIDRIFEPFYTTKPTGQGTGLGLCIVQDIVSRTGGKVRVESIFGVGTTFFVTLPVYERRR